MSDDFIERSATDGALFNLLNAYEFAIELAHNSIGMNQAHAKRIATLIGQSLENLYPHATQPSARVIKEKKDKAPPLPQDSYEQPVVIISYVHPAARLVEIPAITAE